MKPVNRTGWLQQYEQQVRASSGPFWPFIATLRDLADEHRGESQFAAELFDALHDFAVTYGRNEVIGFDGPLGDGMA